MKNTELIKVEGILNYKEELNKVKELTQEKYTAREAAEYFGCAKSQIKGYHINYRDVFGDTIKVEGINGEQRTIISQDGMFLLAILLNKKTKVSEETFNNVLAKVVGQQMSMDETAATKETVKESKKDNMIDFKDLKKKKENKSKNDASSIKISVTPIKITKENMDKIIKDANEELDNMDYIPEEIKDMLRSELNSTAERIKKGFKAEEVINNIINELNEETDSCRCEECLEQEFNEMAHEAAVTRLELEVNLDCQAVYTARYKEICSLLGIDDLEASIMIQRSIVSKDSDIDKDILFHLIDEKSMEIKKKMGTIKQSVELLAEEKCDSIEEAYMLLVQELRYVIGKNLTELVKEKRYDEITKTIVINKEFENAMAIIHNYLA